MTAIPAVEPEQRLGGCQCGQVRFAAPARPIALYVCHCTQCRRQSSSAFGISFTVPRSQFQLLQGEPLFWSRHTASDHELTGAFCADCGSRLWHQSSGYPDTLNVKGGAFDEALDLSAAIHIWVSSKLPGILIPASATSYPQEPPRG